MSRIIEIRNAPLPTPDPWATDAPDVRRCPACALANPGADRCRRCGIRLVQRVDLRHPLSVNLLNLCVVLAGKGPILLAIALLYRSEGEPLVSPWSLWLSAPLPFMWLASGGLALRWRWAWYLAITLSLVDLLGAVGLQLAIGGSLVLTIAVVVTNLILLGFLFTVFDEVRVDYALVELPAPEAMPRTALHAFNVGVGHSKAGYWYFAARLWQRAVALEHHEGRYRRALALAYLHLRELPAAEAELAAASALLPGDSQVTDMRATLELLRKT